MSGTLGCKLYGSIWRRVSPLLRAESPSNVWSLIRESKPADIGPGRFRRNWSRSFSSSPRNGRQVTRRFASGGFLIVGTTSNSTTAAVESGTTCALASEKVICPGSTCGVDRRRIERLAMAAWRRSFHTSRAKESPKSSDNKNDVSSKKEPPSGDHPAGKPVESEQLAGRARNADVEKTNPPGQGNSVMDRIPHIHRPTREELLAAATGFWSRLKVRFKWFSIRSVRPFNMDEIGAFFSWILLGHVVWVIVGTTTFFSLLILAINTVFAQETLARWVGNYLTKSSGLQVVFESAIVPKWKDNVITFKNVFVSRRPGQGAGNVSKGSSKTAAATAAAAALKGKSYEEINQLQQSTNVEDEDTNYTQFDVSIDTVNVTLSFTKWFNGRGLLRDVEVKGIRGVVDRTHVYWPDEDIDPKSYRHEHNPGDFELDSFKMEDVLVTVHQPGNFRPFPVSIYSCDLPQLRRQWLFYDFLSANMMSGSFDNSLFTIHPRQTHRYTGAQLNDGVEENGKPNPWKKHSRIRIDALNIDHLNREVEGPFSWIHEGNVDIVADIMFPADNDESLAKVMSDFYERLEATVTSNRYQPAPGYQTVQNSNKGSKTEEDKRFLVTDLRIHLNNVKAVVPLFTRDLSYVNNALIRPIVAYINSKRTFIPIQCRLVKRVTDFDGSWTIFDSGLMDDLSAETYEAFAQDVVDEQARKRRLKKVGLWSLQLAAQAIFMGMAGNIIA